MTLRTRLVIAAAAAVALSVALASVLAYVLVRGQLRGQIDDALQARAQQISMPNRHGPFLDVDEPRFGGARGYAQVVYADGTVVLPRGVSEPLLPTEGAVDVAQGGRKPFFGDETVAGYHLRVFTTSIPTPLGPAAAQIARPLDEVDGTLHRLALLLVAVALAGIALAAGAGLLVARATLAPVRRLTATAEHVAVTHDLTQRIEATGEDELARLARSFNAMLGALEESVGAQRRLVADASHELRTPLTSLRTNVEVLERSDVSEEVRKKIVEELRGELEELTGLVQDLVELARGHERPGEPEAVRLDEIVASAVERAQRYAPSVSFVTKLEETVVDAVPARVERAVANLIDNAVKWSPAGGTIEVTVSDGELVVRDNGPGIADEDLPHVFERFYRARAARGVPGSGLGLAIVRQVAEEHGGTVVAERAAEGGARMRLRL
jgi:two-component system sensor histidine kinase MprB